MKPVRLSTVNAPRALYHFDGNLRDSSGNGLDLAGGTPVYRDILPGVVGLVSGTPARAVSDAALRITGDLTVQMLCVMRAVPSAVDFVGFFVGGETEATNAPWLISFPSQNAVTFKSESGAGVNADYTSTAHAEGLPALGEPFHLVARRKSGVLTWWLNGRRLGAASGVLTTPTGGTTAVLAMLNTGTNRPECFGLWIKDAALTDAQISDEYNRLGGPFTPRELCVESLWTGALTPDGATVAARLSIDSDNLRLAVTDGESVFYSSVVASSERVAKLAVSGLDPDTDYEYYLQDMGVAVPSLEGAFRTAPTVGAASFMVAFSGDAASGSDHTVFEAIVDKAPLMFIHLGDIHYGDIGANDPALYHEAYDQVFRSERQAELYSKIPTAYVWDDHDYATNDSDAGASGHNAACQVYRARVPHYPLPDSSPTGAIYQAFTIGRVLFLVTDQRSAASAKAATDNASKTVLGAAQKTWLKAQLLAATGKLVVLVCPRAWGGVATAGADHWGGFTTERKELADYIKANCAGRVIVLSADRHGLDIDDGSHHDFATGGGEPMKTFQAAPLDQALTPTYGGATYSQGSVSSNGQFGTMTVEDTGGASVGVTWRGYDSDGDETLSYAFSVSL